MPGGKIMSKIKAHQAENSLPFLLPLFARSLGHLWFAQKHIHRKTNHKEQRMTAAGGLRILRYCFIGPVKTVLFEFTPPFTPPFRPNGGRSGG